MKQVLLGTVCAGLLSAAGAAPAWKLASYTPSAVAPQLPAPAQAVELSSGQRAPLWWLRRPHREALAMGWLGVPPQAPTGRTLGAGLRTQAAKPVQDDRVGDGLRP